MVEVIDTQNIEKTLKHPGGRPITVPWRFDGKGDLIILNPKWTDYFHFNYINKYGCKVKCNLCNREVVQSKLNRHQQSGICKRKRAANIIPET